MQALARTIGLGYLALALLVAGLKALLPLGPLGYAPLAVPLGPGSRPLEVVIWYSSEKQAWLEEAARRFAAEGGSLGGRPIALRLVSMGSGEIAERAAAQDWGATGAPAAISPASTLWLDQLRSRGGATAGEARPLVLTPLVAVAWAERAGLIWPEGGPDFWQNLGDAITNPDSWPGVVAARGFAPDSPEARAAERWGFVKFGHTSPLSSNSGAQTLILLAYAYHEKTSGLTAGDIADPGFQRWLKVIEGASLDFGESTADLMSGLVQLGPGSYDAVMVYENLAIQRIEAAQQRHGQPIRVYYPPATMFSDHPFAVLPVAGGAEQRAAAVFGDYLRSRPMQELALRYGFRPTDPGVSIAADSDFNPFPKFADYGVRADIGAEAATPPAEVVAGLIELWRRDIQPLTTRPRP